MDVFWIKFKNCNKLLTTIFIIVFLTFIISLAFLTKSLLSLTGIETTIRIIILVFFYILWIIYGIASLLTLFTKRNKTFIAMTIFMSLLIPVFFFASHYIDITYNKLDGMSKSSLIYTTNLIALNETSFNESSTIGMIYDQEDIEGHVLANKLITKEKLKNDVIEYEDYYEMIKDLYSKEIDAIFVSGNYVVLFSNIETFAEIGTDTKVLYEYSEEMENKDLASASNKAITEPFSVLILGVDSENDGLNANQAFNGDTLMLMTFNPNTLNATIFSIPRDTYVPIACNNNRYAKINSSAAYGTSCVIKTIEQLTEISIDYYVKINFKGVVDLVNALGGVSINVKQAFCEQNSDRKFGDHEICLKEGEQEVDGEAALAFARHRKTLLQGDIQRVQNQQHLVERMAQKVKNIRNLDDFQNILNAIQKNIDTNMSTQTILSFYNVAKDILIKALKNDNDFVSLERTYLEPYKLDVYLPNAGVYTSALGYYEGSLEEIKNAMKVNLEIKEQDMIKTFSYKHDEEYETRVLGQGIYSGSKLELMPSFLGSTKSYIESWCSTRGITVSFENINQGDSLYNPFYPTGTVVNQSVHEGVLVKTVSSVTIYVINNTGESPTGTNPSGGGSTNPDDDSPNPDEDLSNLPGSPTDTD